MLLITTTLDAGNGDASDLRFEEKPVFMHNLIIEKFKSCHVIVAPAWCVLLTLARRYDLVGG